MFWNKSKQFNVNSAYQSLIESLPPIYVGVVSGDLLRHVSFLQSLDRLDLPQGSIKDHCHTVNVAYNCNVLLQRFLDNPTYKYAWLIGDDHAFDKDIVIRLLAHKKDCIIPLCLRRQPPFIPTLFQNDNPSDLNSLRPMNFEDIDFKQGLLQVHSCGQAGMLLSRTLVESIKSPWFRIGQIRPDKMQEDLIFCEAVRNAGYDIFVDLNAILGHSGTFIIYPTKLAEGKWGFKLKFDYASSSQIVMDPNGVIAEEFVSSEVVLAD